MQVEWLRAFLTVVDRGGFTPAAAHLYRSQGRVSSYIAALERELGVAVFDRDHRPVRLTPAGAAFEPHARSVLEELEAGRNAMASVQGLVRGDVTLATYPSAGASFVPDVLARFSHDYPGVRVELLEHAIHGIDEALVHGRALLAVRPMLPPPRSSRGFEHESLWREPMCLVVPGDHRLAGAAEAAVGDLAHEQLVVSGQHLHYDTEAFRLLIKEGVEPRVRYVSDQPQILVGLVRAGLGLGFTNQLALATVRTEGVSVIPVAPRLYREVGVFWAPGLGGSPAASALLDTLLATPVPAATVALR
ncbi:LysR family transcriptional regulator [Amycolatopsis acidicola]|uniref:LysR family transcriptional regulator n=1 Tax=Amycolatopsis acidicola TaxID=2596893 RepID=A0A5N0V2L8_9PSEU|nr:LysR family transcriptional regulator [Amycolatopsis acidicola]KAA9160064.1 LysR family transcriptional regulator [Amycolatopsis acidicola]